MAAIGPNWYKTKGMDKGVVVGWVAVAAVISIFYVLINRENCHFASCVVKIIDWAASYQKLCDWELLNNSNFLLVGTEIIMFLNNNNKNSSSRISENADSDSPVSWHLNQWPWQTR